MTLVLRHRAIRQGTRRRNDAAALAALSVEPTFAESAAAGISGVATTKDLRTSHRHPAARGYDGSASANSQNAV
jgi:hypothetical protein